MKPQNSQKIFENTISYLLLAAGVFLLTIIVWGLDKGFDFSDEGFILMGYTLPHYIHPGGIYQSVFSQLFSFFDPSLLFYRYLRLVLLLLSIIFLYRSLISYLIDQGVYLQSARKILLGSILLLGALSSYAIFCSILSYNSLTLILGIASLSILINLTIRQSHRAFFIYLFAGASICAYLFFTRFPSAILIACLYPLFVLLSPQKIKIKISGFALFLISAGFFAFTYIWIFYDTLNGFAPIAFYHDYMRTLSYMNHHESSSLLEMYKNSFRYSYEHAVQAHYYLLFAFIISSVLLRIFARKPKAKIALQLIQAALLIYYVKNIIETTQFQSGMIYSAVALEPYLFLGISIIATNAVSMSFSSLPKATSVILCISLLLFPLFCAIGTNNELPLQFLQYLLFWFLLFFLLSMYTIEKKYTHWSNLLFLLCFGFLALAQTISGYVHHPYRIDGSINKLPVQFENKYLKNVYTTRSMNEAQKKIEHLVKAQQKNEHALQIIDFCKVPGIVYSLNGYTPRNAWISRMAVDANIYNLSYLNESAYSTKSKFVADFIFLPNSYLSEPGITSYLSKSGIDIATHYVFLDSVEHPLFHYQVMPIQEKMYIYGHQ